MLEKATVSTAGELEGKFPFGRPTRIITYAWGEKYIGELLSMTLPALLAPGNLPYVASVVPCELVILTQETFLARFLADPTVGKIKELCQVRLVELDDFIPSPDKYGIALTHVLHRGFSDLGPSMTDAWLIFLNADFILADGSLRNLMRRFAEGKRLIASPSYCVNSEAVTPTLHKRVDPHSRALSLSPREMAALVLRHRHSTIRGKTVNQSFFSMLYMDQFYWLFDRNTLLGHQMPVAIVGMQPERHVAQPNSYWDHGLMEEFFPTAEAFVIGDSDEFLMLELRGESVAQEQIRLGPPDPSEVARNLIGFLTPYQQKMAQYPLTLHAEDLPADLDDTRAKLRAFIDSVFAYLPATLPSHLDHPQWNYHLPGFIEGRHRYLSSRLGSLTESSDPPASFNEVDRLWWKIDGVIKSYSRRRSELSDLWDQQRAAVTEALAHTDEALQSRRAEICKRVLDDLGATQPEQTDLPAPHDQVPELSPEEIPPEFPVALSDRQAPEVARILSRRVHEWLSMHKDLKEQRDRIAGAGKRIDEYYQNLLLRMDSEYVFSRTRLQADYDSLMKVRIESAAIPHVVMFRSPQQTPVASGEQSDRVVTHIARRFYHKCFGRLVRIHPWHPYGAPMRHLLRIVDSTANNGAAKVLVVGGSGMADRVANDLRGTHARVALPEVLQGNLDKAFTQNPGFDLCVCSLGPAELRRFADIIKAVAPCMRSGGKVVGLYPNFGMQPLSIDDIKVLQAISDISPSIAIHYAGSEKSAHVVQRFHHAASRDMNRLSNLLRLAALLFIITPRALAANRAEAVEDPSSPLTTHCTSITIEATV